jgi:hypothetical protein
VALDSTLIQANRVGPAMVDNPPQVMIHNLSQYCCGLPDSNDDINTLSYEGIELSIRVPRYGNPAVPPATDFDLMPNANIFEGQTFCHFAHEILRLKSDTSHGIEMPLLNCLCR